MPYDNFHYNLPPPPHTHTHQARYHRKIGQIEEAKYSTKGSIVCSILAVVLGVVAIVIYLAIKNIPS